MVDPMQDGNVQKDGYFGLYSHYSSHERMLKDQVRTKSYHSFILKNPELFKNKVVLDIGCGTGILSLMAAKAGASHVIAVDNSEMIYKAMEIAKENGFSNKITFIQGLVEDIALPVDKVDIIISEWMGRMLLYESMMDTVLFARDKWLKDSHHVYPNKCSMSLVAMGDEAEYESNIDFWEDIEGFKMSCLRKEVLKEARVMIVDKSKLISSTDVFKKYDISNTQVADQIFEADFSLTMLKNTMCHALVSYFDVWFDVPTSPVYFSTGPESTPTHWKQTVFFLEKPFEACTGDVLKGTIKISRELANHRSLIVCITMKLISNDLVDIDQTYTIEAIHFKGTN